MRTHARRPAARSVADPAFGRSRGDAPARPPLSPANAGHDLARVSVSAPGAAQAPVQRVRWTWDAANGQWSGPPGASHARQPPHPGTRDGQAYEDDR